MGRRRKSNLWKQINNMYTQKRKKVVECRVPIACPRCHMIALRTIRDPKFPMVTFFCGYCKLRETLPRHPIFKLVDLYGHLCNYIESDRSTERVYHYKIMSAKNYEELLKSITVGKIEVTKVVGK